MLKRVCLLVLGAAMLAALAPPVRADVELSSVDWQTLGTSVRFHIQFHNPDPALPSLPVSGGAKSQPLGVFVDDYGDIGSFNVPPVAPNSFFDVFLEVPLSSLPPTAQETVKPDRLTFKPGVVGNIPGCPPDDHWDGNVDVFWNGPGGAGQVMFHMANIQVCPGRGNSFIHVVTHCAFNSTWAIVGGCPGFNISLVGENPPGVPDGPAPANLPPGWSGFISVSAAANVPVGTQCCFQVTFLCNNMPATINLCANACDCIPIGVKLHTWGTIRRIYR